MIRLLLRIIKLVICISILVTGIAMAQINTTTGNSQLLHSQCGWKDKEQLFTEAERITTEFRKLKFNPLYNLIGYRYESEAHRKAVDFYFKNLSTEITDKSDIENENLILINMSFDKIISRESAKQLKGSVKVIFDAKNASVASAHGGAIARLVVNSNLVQQYFVNTPNRRKISSIDFIIAHELGHMVVEFVRSSEIGSFEKANDEEFFGQLKHHLLVDVVGMHLAQINIATAVEILNGFPKEGDFSKRVACFTQLL